MRVFKMVVISVVCFLVMGLAGCGKQTQESPEVGPINHTIDEFLRAEIQQNEYLLRSTLAPTVTWTVLPGGSPVTMSREQYISMEKDGWWESSYEQWTMNRRAIIINGSNADVHGELRLSFQYSYVTFTGNMSVGLTKIDDTWLIDEWVISITGQEVDAAIRGAQSPIEASIAHLRNLRK